MIMRWQRVKTCDQAGGQVAERRRFTSGSQDALRTLLQNLRRKKFQAPIIDDQRIECGGFQYPQKPALGPVRIERNISRPCPAGAQKSGICLPTSRGQDSDKFRLPIRTRLKPASNPLCQFSEFPVAEFALVYREC